VRMATRVRTSITVLQASTHSGASAAAMPKITKSEWNAGPRGVSCDAATMTAHTRSSDAAPRYGRPSPAGCQTTGPSSPHHRALRGGIGTLMVFLRSIIVQPSRSEWTGWDPFFVVT
jgi:hypothetical protein